MAADSQKNIPEPATPPSNEPPGAADQKPDTGGAHASGAQGGAVASKEERHTPPPPPRRTRKFLGRLAWICVILYFLGAGLWLGSKYFLFPFIEEQKPEIERTISEILQVPLKFDNLHVDWSGLSPEFSVSNIRLGSKGEGLLTADSLSGKISLQSLTGLEPSFESLTLRNPKLTVRRTGPLTFSIFGAGFNLGNISTSSVGVEGHLKKLPEDILLLLKQKKLEVTGGEVRYIDGQSGQSITIKDLNALWEKDGSNRKFAFTLTPPPEIALPITIRGVLKPSKADPSAVSDWNADLYANTEFINFGELAKWMPDFNVKYKGIGTGSLWTSLEKWSPVSASFIGARPHGPLIWREKDLLQTRVF